MGFFFAWAIGEGIIVYRWVKNGAPPTPGALLLPSGLYVGLAILAEYQPARFAATAFAYAVDVAVLMQVLGKDPKQKTGWPPAMINDPTVILPGGAATAELTAYNATGVSPGASTTPPPAGGGSSGTGTNPGVQIV